MTALTTPPLQPSRGEESRVDPAAMRVIWLLLVAAFVAILNETTMGIAIPHLNKDLGLPPEVGQWLTSAFMLAMAVVIPTTGFLLQRFTTRRVFLFAMTAFTAGTLLCLVAPGFPVLLTGRVVQAVGTGIMMPLLMTTIMNVVPSHSRGRMMGRVGLVISLAPAIGPSLSGAILDSLHWRWIFAVVLPIAVLSLVLGAAWMTNLGQTTKARIDVLSVILSVFAFGGIVFGLSQIGAGHGGESSRSVAVSSTMPLAVIAAGFLFLSLFVWRQLALQRGRSPLLDLRVFRSRNFTLAVMIMAVLAMSMFGTLTLLPQYLQNVAGFTALESGLVLLPGSILMGLLAPLIGRIYDSVGPRPLLIPGTLLVSGVLFFYSTLTPSTPVTILVPAQTAMAVGLAMSFTPLFSSALGSLQRSLYSHGSAALNTLQQVGGAAGVSILLTAYSASLHAGEEAGLGPDVAGAPGARTAFFVAALLSLIPLVLSSFVGKPPEQTLEGLERASARMGPGQPPEL